MIPVTSVDIEKTVADQILSLTPKFGGADRALLFCWSRDECDRMGVLLNWKAYHSSISPDERSENKQLWLRGESVGLVCTSMLNCCLDYPSVRYVFHLSAPRDATDYNQAIGRCARDGRPGYAIVYFDPRRLKKITGDDWFGANVIYDTLQDNTTCRRLRVGMFFDGVSVPCVMISGAQLCDICEAQLSQVPPETGPVRFPSNLLPDLETSKTLVDNCDRRENSTSSSSKLSLISLPNRAQSLATRLNNPLNHPAPSASFGSHFAAAQSSVAHLSTKPSDEYLKQIHAALQMLAKCCVYCWSQDFEYDTHSLCHCAYYANNRSPMWKIWTKQLKFPVGCCFFCGCPLKVS